MELGNTVLGKETEEGEGEKGSLVDRSGEGGAAVDSRVSFVLLSWVLVARRGGGNCGKGPEDVRKIVVVRSQQAQVPLESRDVLRANRLERANLKDVACQRAMASVRLKLITNENVRAVVRAPISRGASTEGKRRPSSESSICEREGD